MGLNRSISCDRVMEDENGSQGAVTRTLNFTLLAEEDPEKSDHAPLGFKLVTENRIVRVFEVDETEHSIGIMQDIHHPNILRIISIISERNKRTVLAEAYGDTLFGFLDELISDGTKTFAYKISVVRTVFRQIIEGMAYIMEHNLFHGGFSLENTYVSMENDEPVVKLSKFIGPHPNWRCELAESFYDDCCLIGNALESVIELLVINNRAKLLPRTCELKDLSIFLKAKESKIGFAEMKRIPIEKALFWSPEKRAAVFTYNIPMLFKDKDFSRRVAKYFQVPSDFLWKKPSDLLQLMNSYRTSKLGKRAYNGTKKTHYLKFVCGSYTHENQLKKIAPWLVSVDETFRKSDPNLCINVLKIVMAHNAEKLQKGET